MIEIIIPILLLLLLLLFLFLRFKRKRFWWQQPILFSKFQLGSYKIIYDKKVPLIDLNSKYVSNSFNFPHTKVTEFLYSYFDRESSYSLGYFEKVFNKKHFCVVSKSKIVGTILSRLIKLQFNLLKGTQSLIYVDGMCIHPAHRKQGVCSHLMSRLARFFHGKIIIFRKDGVGHGFLPFISTCLYKIPKIENKMVFEEPRKKNQIMEIKNSNFLLTALLHKNIFEKSVITYYLPSKGPPTVIRWNGTKTHLHWNFFLRSVNRSSAFIVASRNTCKLKFLPHNVKEQKINFYAWNLRFPQTLTWDEVSLYSILL